MTVMGGVTAAAARLLLLLLPRVCCCYCCCCASAAAPLLFEVRCLCAPRVVGSRGRGAGSPMGGQVRMEGAGRLLGGVA